MHPQALRDLFALIVTGASAAAAQVPVASVSPHADLASDSEPGLPATLSWADWSGDGLRDAFACQPDGTSLLLENTGDGRLEDRTESAGLGTLRGVRHGAFGDVDGDGKLDLFVSSWAESTRLFIQGTAGDFIDVTQSSGIPEGLLATASRWIDYDGDGVLDLHLTTQGGDELYRGLGRARFERVELGLVAAGAPPGVTIGTAPSPTPAGPSTVGGNAPAASSGVNVTATPVPPVASAGNGAGICAATIEDVASGNCITASSAPTLGSLYPLSSSLFVASNGRVGMGTTSPAATLDVNGDIRGNRLRSDAGNGTSPLLVSSNTLVQNLNADLLDGMSAGSFRLAGAAITSGDIANGTITNVDVSASAAIAGTKIAPSFGAQTVVGTGGAIFDRTLNPGFANVRAASSSQGIYGILGGLGSNNYAGVPSADFAGRSMGVTGIALGSATAEYIGVLGHGRTAGVRGESVNAPLLNYGLLGAGNVGVFGRGVDAAGRFEGEVEVDNNSGAGLTIVAGTGVSRSATITNPDGGSVLRLISSTVGSTDTDTVFNVNTQNRGTAARFDSTSQSATLETMRVSSLTNANNHDLSYFLRSGDGTGSAIRINVPSDTATADGLEVAVDGTGRGAYIESDQGTGLFVNKITNAGDIISVGNGTDAEFRVDSAGNAFVDVAFNGGGADYAEWLPKANLSDSFRKGDVVGVFAGEISHDLDGADSILVISTNPVLVGNCADAADDAREGHEVVAFLGQVPVRVRGQVHTGDLLIPSGKADGTAVAVAPEDLRPNQLAMVIGRAWESGASRRVVHTVNAAIGLERGRVAAITIEAMRTELDGIQSAMEGLAERLDSLEQR